MNTLIVPDIHERLDRLTRLLQDHIEKADRVVFLGDWFDAFGVVDLHRVGQICQFINGHIDGITHEGRTIPVTFLLGNHDCHYFFSHGGFKCSGYNHQKWEVIDTNVPDGIREKFQISTTVGPYRVSHAGYTEATLPYCRPEVEKEALAAAFAGEFDPLFGAGHARGGSQLIGGPTWLDWNNEFEHIEDYPQIVGHTEGKDVRVKGGLAAQHNSYCLDTGLRHCLFVDEVTGVVTIKSLETP